MEVEIGISMRANFVIHNAIAIVIDIAIGIVSGIAIAVAIAMVFTQPSLHTVPSP